jgi:hypothetical protein
VALLALAACGGGGGGDTSTPVAVNDSYTTAAGQVTLPVSSPGVLANDSGSGLTAELVTPPANHAGTFTLNANGSFTYVLSSTSMAMTDSFTYRAKNGTASSATATVTINITPPTATADYYSVSAPGALLTVGSPGVLANDSGTGMTAELVGSPPAHATSFTLNANGSFSYTHDGTSTPTTVSFTYHAKVGSLVSSPATVTLTINRPPVASGGCKNTAWNTPVSIDLKPLISDADNSVAPTNFAITVQGTKGSASVDANGMATYVPNSPTVTGADSFTYRYTDPAGAQATGQVKIAIGNRIMPVGDSVTAGIWTGVAPSASGRASYRRKLYADLTNGGKNTISFVGQYLEGCSASPPILDIHCGNTSDPAMEGAHHDGTRGLQDDTLKSSSTVPDGNNDNSINDDGDIVDRLNLNPADIVLIHIGTNGIDGTDTTVDAASIVTNIRNWETSNRPVTVLFARIISSPNSTYAANANTRNNTAEVDLSARSDWGGKVGGPLDPSKRLFMVDMQAAAPNGAGLSYVIDTTDPYTSGDMYDDYHPNPVGYDKMADAWRNALTSIGLACP